MLDIAGRAFVSRWFHIYYHRDSPLRDHDIAMLSQAVMSQAAVGFAFTRSYSHQLVAYTNSSVQLGERK